MVQKFIQYYLPKREKILKTPGLKFLNRWLNCPELWSWTQNSLARACAIGLFCAWFPMPCHTFLAACLAVYFQANLTLSIALVWIVMNPISMPFFYFFAYQLGAKLLQIELIALEDFRLSIQWFLSTFVQIWKPFVLGSLILAILSAVIGYYFIILCVPAAVDPDELANTDDLI